MDLAGLLPGRSLPDRSGTGRLLFRFESFFLGAVISVSLWLVSFSLFHGIYVAPFRGTEGCAD